MSDEALEVHAEATHISGSFESNRGRLSIPITGSSLIVSHFGQYKVDFYNQSICGEATGFCQWPLHEN